MANKINALKEPFLALKNRVFATLYFAESISLLGDAFTWVGLALLSYQFGKERSAIILATSLTLRVTAFIIFSPFAGVLADRVGKPESYSLYYVFYKDGYCCLPAIRKC